MMDDRANWKLKLRVAARDALARALKEIRPANLCGFALCTDESAMSLTASINIEAHLKIVTAGDETESVYYRWSPPEWFNEWYADELFDDINEILLANFNNHTVDDSENEIEAFDFFEECVCALEDLKTELSPEINENFILLFEVSDYEDIAQQAAWARRINGAEKARDYEAV